MSRNFDIDGWLEAAYEERFEMDDEDFYDIEDDFLEDEEEDEL